MAERESTITVQCTCGQRMRVPATAVGKSCRCTKCKNLVTIREQVDEAPKPKPAASKPSRPPKPSFESKGPIGELLIQAGLVTPAQVAEALELQKSQGGKTFENLIALGHLDKNDLHAFLSRQEGVAAIDLSNYEIERSLVELIPKEMALKELILPIDRLGKLLTVGMACPLDQDTIEHVRELTGLRVKAVLVKLDDIISAVQKYYPLDDDDNISEATLSSLNLRPMLAEQKEQEAETDTGETEAQTPAPSEKPVASEPAPVDTPAPSAPAPQPVVQPGSTFTRDDVADAIRDINVLATRADTVAQLRAALESGQNTHEAIVDIVNRDPAVAMKLLSVANSGAYGLSGKITSVAGAIAVLGLDGACMVALELGSGSAQEELPDNFDYKDFQQRSVFSARAAQAIAAHAKLEKYTAMAYTAGLLHAIGQLGLAEALGDIYAETVSEQTHADLARLEKERFRLTHTEAGALLCNLWRLPDPFSAAIKLQMDPASATNHQDLVMVIALARALQAGFRGAGEAVAPDALQSCKDLLDHFGLTTGQALKIVQDAAK